VIANKKFWDGLPPDIRADLDKAMTEATAFTNDIAQKENDDALAEIRKSGKSEVLELTAEQKAAWRKALEPVYTEMASRVGKDTIAEFQKEAASATH
jgi:C4-dicarboxylate-binding protein DctP